MRGRAGTLAALVATLALAGCRVASDVAGDDRFLHEDAARSTFVRGTTTLDEVVLALGPPDEAKVVEPGELWLTYRYREASERQVVVRYYLDVLKWSGKVGEETMLVVVLDRHDRVLTTTCVRSKPE